MLMASNLDIHLVKNNHRNLFISFRVSLLTNQQTNQRYQKHRLLGGGKKGRGRIKKSYYTSGKDFEESDRRRRGTGLQLVTTATSLMPVSVALTFPGEHTRKVSRSTTNVKHWHKKGSNDTKKMTVTRSKRINQYHKK